MKPTIERAIQHQRDQCIVYDSCLVQDAKAALFDPLFWGGQASHHREGRGTVWFLSAPEGQWVLKRYVRGGMMQSLLKDAYLFTGFMRTRMVREFNLLCQMRSQGLPVPTPVAAYAVKVGPFFYGGSLITERITESASLASLIVEDAMSEEGWLSVGSTIAEFHRAGICHYDLNVTNVLNRQDQWFLIDFDKCRFMSATSAGTWRRANLQRFRRSLGKISPDSANPESPVWKLLMRGYEAGFGG
jgi:3-deoxy-D-manno-octulosonic acid kinase